MSKVPAQERPENQHPDVAHYVTEAGWVTHDIYGNSLVPELGALPVVDAPSLRPAPKAEVAPEVKPKAPRKPKTVKEEVAAEVVEETVGEAAEESETQE